MYQVSVSTSHGSEPVVLAKTEDAALVQDLVWALIPLMVGVQFSIAIDSVATTEGAAGAAAGQRRQSPFGGKPAPPK